jgi:hypothetical protein
VRAHGTPLCQDRAAASVLGWWLAGPGCGFSEEPISGVRSVALECAANSLPLAVIALVVMRLASGYVIALDTTILLETVPPRLRGRIVSLHMTTYSAVARISLAAVGAALTAVTISTIGIGAGLTSAGFGVVWWWRSGRPARTVYQTPNAAIDPDDGRSDRHIAASD